MSIVNSLLKVFLGDKSGKDLKKLTPIVDEINNHFNRLSSITNDQLRDKTIEFKKLISDETEDLNSSVSDLNDKLSNELSNTEKEEIFKHIESLENDLIEKKSEVLDRLLPEAFAVVKETAKRFFENEEIKVTASDFDKEIASKKSYTKIDSDNAIWKNNWDAAGNATQTDIAGNFISQKQIMTMNILEQFAPLLLSLIHI